VIQSPVLEDHEKQPYAMHILHLQRQPIPVPCVGMGIDKPAGIV
jgi:hypothetical protein